MIERTDADWQQLCSEVGRLCGEVVTLRRVAVEREAELADARAQIAAMQQRLVAPPDGGG